MPSRAAVGRSITTVVCSPRVSWSLLTSASCGALCSAACRRGVQVRSASRSSLCSVYWYDAGALPPADAHVLDRHQPQIHTGLLRELRAQPRDDLARRLARSFSGLSETNIVPELREPPPVTAVTVSTAGSARTISTSRLIFCCIAWNELDWSARIQPIRRPVSCCGKKPFGISMYR